MDGDIVNYGREIGSVFRYNRNAMVVERATSITSPCDGCVFMDGNGCNAMTIVGYCKSLLREDGENVVFKNINDNGEVY